jgi:hypothetical protein
MEQFAMILDPIIRLAISVFGMGAVEAEMRG